MSKIFELAKDLIKRKNLAPKRLMITGREYAYNIKTIWHELSPKSRSDIFSKVMEKGIWSGQDSLSGHGSDFESTAFIRTEIPKLLKDLEIRTLLDAPCGDFYWMNLIEYSFSQYIGIDIVQDLIASNQENFSNECREFKTLDLVQDPLPQMDAILCRDCLVHLPFRDIIATLKNFQASGSSYLISTTYPNLLTGNKNIITGDWRPIDLELPPFNLPQPICLIQEKCITDLPQKSLAVWKLADLKL